MAQENRGRPVQPGLGALDKERRTAEEYDGMVHAAHASRFHEGEIGTALEIGRGKWQVSRVYSVLDRRQAVIYHAGRCLEICTANRIGDFDLAFAYEALARAYAVAGEAEKTREFVRYGDLEHLAVLDAAQ